MPLTSPLFIGDPILEQCLAGAHRMMAPEQGLAVLRVQKALMLLNHDVGPSGLDGSFGDDTGAAVVAFKRDNALSPEDAVVGPGTTARLDAFLFFDPPSLDPLFGEFAPFVVARRLEPFVAIELSRLHAAPLDSVRHEVARFALTELHAGRLLGIVATTAAPQLSRLNDLRARYDAEAAALQPSGATREELFDSAASLGGAAGSTFAYRTTSGEDHAFIVIDEIPIRGKAQFVQTSTGRKTPFRLSEVLVHELTHARNIVNRPSILQTSDADSNTYLDTALAQTRSAAGGGVVGTRTVDELRRFVEEMTARHVHWVVTKENIGDLAVIDSVTGAQLALAANEYVRQFPTVLTVNGYLEAFLLSHSEGDLLRQIGMWLLRCQEYSFSKDANKDARTRQLFGQASAAAFAMAEDDPIELTDAPDGLHPLLKDLV